MLQDIHTEFIPLFDTKHQTLAISGCDSTIVCDVDADKFRQVVVNLLSNAHKFTPSEGAIAIEAQLISGANEAEIRIRDSGMGIESQHLSTIFEKFGQVKNSLTRDINGTGLGLAIVKTIVERFDGSICVESEM